MNLIQGYSLRTSLNEVADLVIKNYNLHWTNYHTNYKNICTS